MLARFQMLGKQILKLWQGTRILSAMCGIIKENVYKIDEK